MEKYRTYPNVEAALRFGAAESLDIGFTLSTNLMIRTDFNWAPIMLDNFALSIDPTFEISTIGFAYNDSGPLTFQGSVPVLADVVSTENQTLTLAFKPGIMASSALKFLSKQIKNNYLFTLGGSIGYRIKVVKDFTLLPEVSVLVPMLVAHSPQIVVYNLSWAFVI